METLQGLGLSYFGTTITGARGPSLIIRLVSVIIELSERCSL